MGKGPTRKQGPGKASDDVRALKRGNRNADPHSGRVRGGFHDVTSPHHRRYDDTRERLDEHLDEKENEEEDVPHPNVNECAGRAVLALLQDDPETALNELQKHRLEIVDGEPFLADRLTLDWCQDCGLRHDPALACEDIKPPAATVEAAQ